MWIAQTGTEAFPDVRVLYHRWSHHPCCSLRHHWTLLLRSRSPRTTARFRVADHKVSGPRAECRVEALSDIWLSNGVRVLRAGQARHPKVRGPPRYLTLLPCVGMVYGCVPASVKRARNHVGKRPNSTRSMPRYPAPVSPRQIQSEYPRMPRE